jgi:three-Cys-motif partner protein
MTSFGGDWTREKLDRVSAYLAAFQNVLKHQDFRLVYIDAFSGDGGVELRGEELPLLEQGREFTQGSARRAIALPQPFDRYHFIDASGRSLDKLKVFVESEHSALSPRMNYHRGDVNVEIPKAISQLDARKERAVVFADPFGMQLDWETIKAIGSKPVDFWYLAPTMAINRVLTRDGQLPESWANRLDRSLGVTDWRTGFYKSSVIGTLFGSETKTEKVGGIDEIENFIHARLGTVFMMAKNRLRLSDRGRPLFSLMFGCSNASPKAFGKATKIANHLLKG